ncbi:MAG TPA: DMT family transporter [Gemmatimonadales bacterium]|nr:DMT family transporter [Gemmatimonadales bacterium]
MQSPSFPRTRLVLAAVLFSTGGAAIKSAAFTGWQVASFRSGVAALVLLLFLPEARRGWTWRAAVVGIAYAATLILYVLANRLTTSANTIFLQSTAPLYLLLFGPWLLHEPVRPRDVALMALVALGLAMFFVAGQEPLATAPDPARGDLLAALSGVTWALTVVGLRWMAASEPGPDAQAYRAVAASGVARVRTARGGESALAAVVVGNVIACAAALPLALPVAPHAAPDWLVIIYLGAIQIGLAYVFVTSALRAVPAFTASMILLVEPALNPLWTWVLEGEVPGAWALVGGAVILGATAAKTWLDSRKETALDMGARPPEPCPPTAA